MQPSTFRTSFFAVLPSYAAQIIAGNRESNTRPIAAGSVGIWGVLGGESDYFAETHYGAIRQSVKRQLADPSVKTIDLLIDSPGGSVLGLPETADVIHAANKHKPVRAFVTGIAASAAYWLASQASTVTLTPSGEVGSVGVLDLSVDISKALESSGVKVNAVSSTPEKIERAPFLPLSDDARAHMQASVNDWYSQFLGAIRRGRGARVRADGNYGNGRMLGWRDALALGMVDFIGGVQ
jgi:signal peptide peptidase SppA